MGCILHYSRYNINSSTNLQVVEVIRAVRSKTKKWERLQVEIEKNKIEM